MALPLARLSDRGNRVKVLSWGIFCWSLATLSCGLAGSFLSLFIARMLVGVGEATLGPAGYSLAGDSFSKEKVSFAISVFVGSGFIGSGLAYVAGGFIITKMTAIGTVTLPLIGTLQPWQLTFMSAAVPAFVLLAIVLMLREPPRRGIESDATARQSTSLFAAFTHLKTNPPLFGCLFFGLAIMAAGGFAVGAWTPTFFIRIHGWSTMKVGATLGVIVMTSSCAGSIFGGWLASILTRRGYSNANLKVATVSGFLSIIPVAAFPQMQSSTASLLLFAPALFLSAMPFGCGSAVIPLIVPNRLRAQMMAVYFLIANLIGFSLGPTSVAVMTDHVFGDPQSINTSLSLAASFLFALGAFLTLLASRYLLRSGLYPRKTLP
jgi:MFS family permease